LVSEQVPSRNSLTTGRRSWITLELGYHSLMVRNMHYGKRKYRHTYMHMDSMFGNQWWMDTKHQLLLQQTRMERNSQKIISRAKNAIQNGVDESIFTKIMHCESTKEMWDKLNTIYEGDEKVKEAKLQIFRAKFE
jgi:hypothetical protein